MPFLPNHLPLFLFLVSSQAFAPIPTACAYCSLVAPRSHTAHSSPLAAGACQRASPGRPARVRSEQLCTFAPSDPSTLRARRVLTPSCRFTCGPGPERGSEQERLLPSPAVALAPERGRDAPLVRAHTPARPTSDIETLGRSPPPGLSRPATPEVPTGPSLPRGRARLVRFGVGGECARVGGTVCCGSGHVADPHPLPRVWTRLLSVVE